MVGNVLVVLYRDVDERKEAMDVNHQSTVSTRVDSFNHADPSSSKSVVLSKSEITINFPVKSTSFVLMSLTIVSSL